MSLRRVENPTIVNEDEFKGLVLNSADTSHDPLRSQTGLGSGPPEMSIHAAVTSL